jgi:D-serine deaminase-like pyridoxal phosphate-dependent protein
LSGALPQEMTGKAMVLNRRAFLAATAATGLATTWALRSTPNGCRQSATPLPELGGKTKADLATPALLLDLDAFEFNLKALADHCKVAGIGFRPHAKTHKCVEIARRQVASGSQGVCVATVPEAEAMVAAGIRGVLLTSPIIQPSKIARMVALVNQGGEVLLAVGHTREAELLIEATDVAQVPLDVLVAVDVGDRRTGTLPGQASLDLARLLAKGKYLRVRGLQAYSGVASHRVGFRQREEISRQAMGKAVETRELLAKNGFQTEVLSGGSTGTYNIDSTIQGVTELQVGSYIFMDVEYRSIGSKSGEVVYADFQPSLTVLSSVVSASHADRVTVDAGNKAFATDVRFMPQVKGDPGLVYQRIGDEFGIVSLAKDAYRLPRLGDRLEFLVPHCDPTVNLYDRIYAMRGDRVEAVWPTVARRDSTPAPDSAP